MAKSTQLSVIVPENPFSSSDMQDKQHCLCALDVDRLMEWWPGTPHSPHRNSDKVRAIQRSLDWKRVAQIAAYLLQEEIIDVPQRLDKYFKGIYQPKKSEPGRQWPPKVSRVVGFEHSEFRTFSNVLVHVNGAKIEATGQKGVAKLVFDQNSKNLDFAIIDGQHRINGAYFALCILRERKPKVEWQIPAEIFLGLDPVGAPPRKQAQIFIDVNFYQKKVDRSLVADLFPTARGREALDQKERAQDIGRKLMLETGPLVGMIQIPGIKYGVKDVVTLATLNGAIEDVLDIMEKQSIESLDMQTNFLAQCLTAWLEASGRFENKNKKEPSDLNPQNVVYQGRVLVSIINLIPAIIWKLKKEKIQFISDEALNALIDWLKSVAKKANLLDGDSFIDKDKFKKLGYLGSGGIGRFRDSLWAVLIGDKKVHDLTPEKIIELANKHRATVLSEL